MVSKYLRFWNIRRFRMSACSHFKTSSDEVFHQNYAPVERRDTLGLHSLNCLRLRKNRDLRPIRDLSALNRRFLAPMLKMDSAQTVEPRCQKDSDGVFLHPSFRIYLRFFFKEGVWQFMELLFGLFISPQVIIGVMALLDIFLSTREIFDSPVSRRLAHSNGLLPLPTFIIFCER